MATRLKCCCRTGHGLGRVPPQACFPTGLADLLGVDEGELFDCPVRCNAFSTSQEPCVMNLYCESAV